MRVFLETLKQNLGCLVLHLTLKKETKTARVRTVKMKGSNNWRIADKWLRLREAVTSFGLPNSSSRAAFWH